MLSHEQPLMSLLQRSVPAKNSQYQDLFVEAGLKDANTFSFRKVHTNESESATLELTVYESQIKLPYDTRNPQKDFENWLRKILRLKR